MRWQHVKVKKRSFINDAYNANPLSMGKSIQTFSERNHTGEKWLVLGGMGELGTDEILFHQQLGKTLDGYGFDGVVLMGEKAAWIATGITITPVTVVSTHKEAAEWVKDQIPENALVLLKGSRSERMEFILSKLQEIEDDLL